MGRKKTGQLPVKRYRMREETSLALNEIYKDLQEDWDFVFTWLIEKSKISVGQKKITVGQKSEVFRKPTVEEVKIYCEDRKNGIDPEGFINFYQSKGWLVGKSKMKDWQACIRTWEKAKSRTTPRKIINLDEVK